MLMILWWKYGENECGDDGNDGFMMFWWNDMMKIMIIKLLWYNSYNLYFRYFFPTPSHPISILICENASEDHVAFHKIQVKIM